ncbi:L,D-transpeptidase [Nocardioides sp. NPDC092400]|uniref:L,D-transpeptidase n=1 Tax=Nocardioides sp. NPDC092400 TaxID=3155196 RepID=UPI00342B96D6
MGSHRATEVRPRYGRIGMLAASVVVTVVAVLGGTGVLPGATPADAGSGTLVAVDPAASAPSPSAPSPSTEADDPLGPATSSSSAEDAVVDPREDTTLPTGTGRGKRVVFSEGRQRVWLVEGRAKVVRTYLVSGSVEDNLDPGTYAVYSRSEQAYGIDDSGTMKYFVRFTQGERAAIGFHDIPVDDGEKVQTVDELGSPRSHGCIRQKRADAIALWDFAPLGTTVVVTA